MKHKFLFTILFVLFVLSTCQFNYAQQLNTISTRCPSPNQRTYSSVIAVSAGDIVHTPCTTRASIFNGNVDFTNATVTGVITSLNGLTASVQTFAAPTANDTASWSSATSTHTLRLPITSITGSSRTNFFPYFDAANTFAKSGYQWSGTRYFWDNITLNSPVTMEFTPSATGNFQIGDYTTTATSYFTQNYNTNTTVIRSTVRTDFNLTTDNVSARFDNALGTFNIRNTDNNANFEFDGTGKIINANVVEFNINGGLFVNDTATVDRFVIADSWTPASAADVCTSGRIGWDSGFIYVCVASGDIKRVAIATW